MKFTSCLIVIVTWLSLSAVGFAQPPSWVDLEARRAAEEREARRQQEERRQMEARRERMEKGMKAVAAAEREPVTLWLESQLPGREKKALAASAEDQKKYEAFLRRPGTGLFKLVAVGSRTVSVDGLQTHSGGVPIRGGGAYYSFTKHRHDADEWAQIKLRQGRLETGISPQETIVRLNSELMSTIRYTPDGLTAFVTLSNVPLENVELQTPGVQFLSDLAAPTEYAELSVLTRRLQEGFRAGDFTYTSSLPANLDTTFVLRSVLYKKADLLITGRIIRQDADGSLHILWRQLKSSPAPTLKGKPSKD